MVCKLHTKTESFNCKFVSAYLYLCLCACVFLLHCQVV